MTVVKRERRSARVGKASMRLVGQLRPVASGYGQHGASGDRKSLLGWLYSGGSPDEDIVEHLDVLRQRSRDLHMGTPLATGGLGTLVRNVVGRGLRLSAQVDADALGISDEDAEAWQQQVEREWSLWAGTQACDAARTCTFGQLQALAFLSTLMSGDAFALLPVVPRAGSIYDLRVQLLEADRICDPSPTDLTRNIYGGVEVGSLGEPVAYHVASRHPLATGFRGKPLVTTWTRLPAFGADTGRRNVLHLLTVERPEQRRGVPVLAPVIESLKQLGRYSDAELMAAVVSAMLTVFVETENPETSPGVFASPIPEDELVDPDNTEPDADDLATIEMGNGAVVGLAPGQKANAVTPGRPNPSFDAFWRSVCVPVGAALGIPYEILLAHFTSSYTAARASFLQFQKTVDTRRDWLITGFCQPVYEEWLAEAVARGRVSAPGFFEDLAVRAAWSKADWFGPSFGQLDERNEVGAAHDRVAWGFSTLSQETAQLTGRSWDDVARERQREAAKQDSAPTDKGTVGAQVTAVLDLVQRVVAGTLERATAVEIYLSIFGGELSAAERLFPAPPPPPPPAPKAPPPPPEQPDEEQPDQDSEEPETPEEPEQEQPR